MSPKITLEVIPETEVRVLAVCAPMRDYRFTWLINNTMSNNFMQVAPLQWIAKKSKAAGSFAVFRDENIPGLIIVNNRSENTFLFQAFATIDFFVIFDENETQENADEWKSTLKKMQGITLVTMLPEKHADDFRQVLSELEYQDMQRKQQNQYPDIIDREDPA